MPRRDAFISRTALRSKCSTPIRGNGGKHHRPETGPRIAAVPELGRGFIGDGDAGEVVVFDLKTLKTTGRVKADDDADSILYDPASKARICLQCRPNNATGIDPAQGTVVATLPLGGAPEQAVADGKGIDLRQPRRQERGDRDRCPHAEDRRATSFDSGGHAGIQRHQRFHTRHPEET